MASIPGTRSGLTTQWRGTRRKRRAPHCGRWASTRHMSIDSPHQFRIWALLLLLLFLRPQLTYGDSASLGKEHAALDREIKVVWGKFCERVRANDIEGAANFIAPETREHYRSDFVSLGNDLSKLPDTWLEPDLVKAFGDYAIYFIVTISNGERLGHELIFWKAPDGRWFIHTL